MSEPQNEVLATGKSDNHVLGDIVASQTRIFFLMCELKEIGAETIELRCSV